MSPKAKEKKQQDAPTGSESPPEESEQFRAFKKLVTQVLSVPKEELDRREAEYKRERKRSS